MVFRAFPQFDLADWEAVLRHGFPHADFIDWLARGDHRARFYDAISLKTRAWSEGKRGSNWHSADALAMAVALAPEGVIRAETRHVAVETEGRLSRGATVVDWAGRNGQAANARIALGYDQAAFEARIRSALGV